MRLKPSDFLESCRITSGPFGSNASYGMTGAIRIPHRGAMLHVIASAGTGDPTASGWEHVSLHVDIHGKKYTPGWDQMCFVKDLFWDEEETVIQFHPPHSRYVNNHPHVLHLWRYRYQEIILPSAALVGVKEIGTIPQPHS